MANEYTVNPANLNPVLTGVGSVIQQNREAQRKQKVTSDFQQAYADGDTDAVARLSIENPELSQIMNQAVTFKSDRSRQNLIDTTMSALADPDNAEMYMQNRIDKVTAEGGDPSDSVNALEMYRNDPEGSRKKMELMLASQDPKAWEAYKAQTGIGGKDANLKQFQPITLVNKKTGEKILRMPTGNPRTGAAELSPLEIPEGYEVSTETTAEKRAADVLAKGAGKAREITEKGKAGRQQDIIDKGLEAADSYANVKRGLDLLNSIETGGIDAVSMRAKQIFGVEGADEAELSNRLSKAVLSQLRETFGAAFTETEGDKLERIEASFGKSTAGNKRLLQQTERIILRSANRAIRAAEKAGDEDTAQEIRDALEFSLSDDNQNGAAANQDDQALQWARSNPDDPRSAQILQKLGVQ